jgi:hypothetical protein
LPSRYQIHSVVWKPQHIRRRRMMMSSRRRRTKKAAFGNELFLSIAVSETTHSTTTPRGNCNNSPRGERKSSRDGVVFDSFPSCG